MKIGLKLTVIMVIFGVFSVGSVGITLLVRANSSITTMAYDNATNSAQEAANVIKVSMEVYLDAVDTLSYVLEQYPAMTVADRRIIFNAILEGVAQGHTGMIGLWCVLEPDVLEGNDLGQVGTAGATSTGRFAPYYYWDDDARAPDFEHQARIHRSSELQ